MFVATALMMINLMVSQLPSEVYYTNERSLQVPLDFSDGDRQQIKQLLLYASRDLGKTWLQVAVQRPDQNGFIYTANSDGPVWLQVAVVNLQGKQLPENIMTSPAQQKMIIDTRPPEVRIAAAQRIGDRVEVRWEILEEHPDWKSFQLEWQSEDSPLWKNAPVVLGQQRQMGQVDFHPGTAATIRLRLTFRDLAKNQRIATAIVPGTSVASNGTPSNIQQTGFDQTRPQLPGSLMSNNNNSNLSVPPGQNSFSPPPGQTPRPANQQTSFPNPGQGVTQIPTHVPGFPGRSPVAQADWQAGKDTSHPRLVASSDAPPIPPAPPPSNFNAPPARQAPGFPGVPKQGVPSSVPNNGVPQGGVPDSSIPLPGGLSAPPPGAQDPIPGSQMQLRPQPKRKLPPLQHVNKQEIMLEYELTRVGPSGVGSVDLWWTQNDGDTWERYAWDPDARGVGRHQRTVQLPGDGIYGFTIVVKSRAGLGRREPKAGDAPEIRVQVDTIAPVAHLFAPIPDRQRGNTLILTWNARDANLHTHPINLEWAEKLDGPWQSIATNMPNIGKHAWQLPSQIPVQVYLRLRVHDSAGNESQAVTPEPLLVDLTEPEGRLISVAVPPQQ